MVLKILQDGGPVMIVILLLSFVALVLIIERFLYFRKIEKNEKRFLEAIFPLLETRDFQSAEKLCARYSCPVAEMTKAGLLNRRLSSEEIKEAMEIRAEAEVPKMERFVGALGTIANIAPLLGLLGIAIIILIWCGCRSRSAGIRNRRSALHHSGRHYRRRSGGLLL